MSVTTALRINPLAQVIEQTRRVAVQDQPELSYLIIGTITTLLICEISFPA